MAAALTLSFLTFRSSYQPSLNLSRLRPSSSSTSSSLSKPPPPLATATFFRPAGSTLCLSQFTLRMGCPGGSVRHLDPIRVDQKCSFLEPSFPYADDPALFLEAVQARIPDEIPGMDWNHWEIFMDKPGGEGATKQQMIDCFIKTLAKVLGSEEEAKKKIYSGCFTGEVSFGCEIDEETATKLEELPGVIIAMPDLYVVPETKDYGGELLVNGEIVQRSPERQRRWKNRRLFE